MPTMFMAVVTGPLVIVRSFVLRTTVTRRAVHLYNRQLCSGNIECLRVGLWVCSQTPLLNLWVLDAPHETVYELLLIAFKVRVC